MTYKHTTLLTAFALCFLPMLAMAESSVGDAHKAPPAMNSEAREAWKNMTPEQRQAKRAEMKAKWEALSPEEKATKKAEMDAKWRNKWQSMTPEQKAEHKAKAKARWDAMPAEKQAEIKAKMGERHQENKMMKRKFRHNQKMKAAE